MELSDCHLEEGLSARANINVDIEKNREGGKTCMVSFCQNTLKKRKDNTLFARRGKNESKYAPEGEESMRTSSPLIPSLSLENNREKKRRRAHREK